ncbi:hypothetical protein ACFQ88_05120 [Paenibacillus sp. NPDC056579]|uniref:hypothetical protein n=1 Tax=unclassified Paenibacillus TaxID=185978 RepID=UPI001EF7D351|nr:hypothetical protein [Paenibacillus sp. H1-7]ULL16361.1 hypothetical protein DVH26_19060 [Paenibacillus sp. H1-7]
MADQPSNGQEQSARTKAQNAMNHALHALNEARHSNVNQDREVQAAKEQLYKARLEHMQANHSDSQDQGTLS